MVPVIRAPRNGAAEAIARSLDSKIHDHLANMGNLFSDTQSTYHRYRQRNRQEIEREIESKK